MFKYLWVFLFALIFDVAAFGQTKFDELPNYKKYQEMSTKRRELVGGGRVDRPVWSTEQGRLYFGLSGKRWMLDLKSGKVEVAAAEPEAKADEGGRSPRGRRMRSDVGRAQQRTIEKSPDGKWQAVYKDFNVMIEPLEGENKEPISVTGHGTERLRFGTCCWVYGEELNQSDAMWWSPDSKTLAYYEVDEQSMKDYHLTMDNTSLYTSLKSVRYPKAGDDNPRVGLCFYNLDTKESRRAIIDGEATQYLYNVRYSPNGKELLVNRTNRHQDVLDLLAIDVQTLAVRTVVTEKQETWQNNSPRIQFLDDGERFLWETEANGWKHFQLRHLDGRLLNPVTQVAEYPCNNIEKVDEKLGWVYYTAFSDQNPYNQQLHRARLDGSDAQRLTSVNLNHTSFDISPDHRYVMAVREQLDVPPSTVVYDTSGKEVAVIAEGNREAAAALKLSPPELFSFTANDGKTQIYGTLHKPSNFDPNKKYPLLIDVYGGPQSQGLSNSYAPANAICELGFLVAKIGNRGTLGRGKAFESATYQKLGGPDMDDQADGVRYLSKRSYVNSKRVGIYGHSYGGYMSALALLRYPDVFYAAVAGAPVTDWANYDTIYTERYMRTPQENAEGYRQGSCNALAGNLKGKLLLVHGLVDDNVHPSNTWQLSKALNDADKRFEMMIYPEFDHGVGGTYGSLRWEFLCQHLLDTE